MSGLGRAQRERYSRHLLLPEIGSEGQEKLLAARVLLVGVGGLGSAVALYLVAGGIGTLGLVDDDRVELSNLQRQIIHFSPDIGIAKTKSASDKLHMLNPDVAVKSYSLRLHSGNIDDIIAPYDFVVDCTDDFPTKFLINDACVAAGIPFSHGGIMGFTGQTMTIIPGQSACYRCVFTSVPPPEVALCCSKAGVLGALAGLLGTIQVAEAMKYILGTGELLTNALLTCNSLSMEFRKIPLNRRFECTCHTK